MANRDFIGIGIIGTGFARSTQIPAFLACHGTRVVSVASGHKSNAEETARAFGIQHFTDDWHEVVNRDDVDLISIATPPITHLDMTLAALDGSKAILCEKPTAINATSADAMRLRAAEVGTLTLIDHELRFLAARRKMRSMILDGEIGDVRHVKFLFRADSRASASKRWNWWSDANAGGGALGAIGSHAVDAFRWMLDVEVKSVSALLTTHIKERPNDDSKELLPVTSDDEANLILRFADGARTKDTTGAVSISVVEPGRPEHRLSVFGSEGALMLESGELLRADIGSGNWQPVNTEKDELAPGMRDNEWSRGFTAFARAITDALRDGRNTIEGAATFEDGYRTQQVLDAAHESSEKECWVSLDKAQTAASG